MRYPESIIKSSYVMPLDQVLMLNRVYPSEVRGERRYLVRDLKRKAWEIVGPYHHDALRHYLNRPCLQIFELPETVG